MPLLSSRRLDVTTVAAAASATDQNTPGPAKHAIPVPVSSVVCDPAVSKRKTEAEMRQVLANKKRVPNSEVKGEEEARLKAEEEARLKTEEEAKLKSEDVLKSEEEARLKAQEDVRLNSEEEVRLKAKEEAKLKAEEEVRRKAKEVGRLKEARPRGEEEQEERSHMKRDKPPLPSRTSPNKVSKVLRKVGKKQLVVSDGGVRSSPREVGELQLIRLVRTKLKRKTAAGEESRIQTDVWQFPSWSRRATGEVIAESDSADDSADDSTGDRSLTSL
jgi:hypothetical protein